MSKKHYYLVVAGAKIDPRVYECDNTGRITNRNNLIKYVLSISPKSKENKFHVIRTLFPDNIRIHKYLKGTKDVSQAVFVLNVKS
jgi:hypothetical protein